MLAVRSCVPLGMVTLVHLTTASSADKVRRGGLVPSRTHFNFIGVHSQTASPTLFATEQWLSQVRKDAGSVLAVYFEVPDDERVELAHLGSCHCEMVISEAISIISTSDDPSGYEIFVLRSIDPAKIMD